MKNKLRAVSAAILAVCSATTVLSACNGKIDNIPSDETTTPAASASVDVATNKSPSKEQTVLSTKAEILSQNEHYTYYKPVTNKATMAFSYVQHTAGIIETQKNGKEEKATQNGSVPHEDIQEIRNGISVITKTSPVIIGNSATIMIQGTPGKKYSIDFYETSSKIASYGGLEDKTADSNGFVTWTFEIKNSCQTGNRKIVVKENDSGKIAQTSITIQ